MGWLVFFLFIVGLGLLLATGCNSDGYGDSIGISIFIVLGFIVSGCLIIQGILYLFGTIWWFINEPWYDPHELNYWETLGQGLIGFIPLTLVFLAVLGSYLPNKR